MRTCERILSELRDYRPHSEPFLVKVKKQDVPDYYDYIKHPMDLGTMSRKLRDNKYTSKQTFVDDLNLIWSNCLLYNTLPVFL